MRCRVLSLVLLPLAALFLMFTSCGEDGIDASVEMPLTEIATFEGNGEGRAVFSFRKVDDTPLVVLTADTGIDIDPERVPARMLIRYIPENGNAYESGPVRLLSASLINSSAVETVWKDGYDRWDRDGVYLYSMWRSGTYLNMHIRLTYSTEPRVFCLAADPATLHTSVPDLYLVHIMENTADNHDRAYYASFDMASVWNRKDVTAVRIHVANTNLDKHIFTFEKTSSLPAGGN